MRLLPTLTVLALCTVLAACATDEPAPPSTSNNGECQETPGITYRTDGQLSFVRADGSEIKTLDIEVARTDSTIARGLMDRKCLPDDWGMLFIFPNSQPRTFYMQNTPSSLDIHFVGPDSTLLNTAKYARPYDPSTLPSDGPAQYVVETPAGFADTHGLQPGDRIQFTLNALAPDFSPADSLTVGD